MNITTKVPIDTGAELLSLPELMKKKRSELGLTQKELADAAGISVSALKQYETGRQEPTIPKVRKIASALGLSANEIWSETDVGSVGDEQLRLAVLQEVTTFITGQADGEQLQVLRDILAKMTNSPIPEDGPVKQVVSKTGFEKLIDLINERGVKARGLPKLLSLATEELENFEIDELEDLGMKFDVDRVPDYEAGDTENIAEILIENILVSVIYGFNVSDLSEKNMKIIVDFLNSEEAQISEQSFFESESAYFERMTDELPSALLKGALQRTILPEDILNNL